MKERYHLFRRKNGIYFIEDRLLKKQNSLQTHDREEARRIFARMVRKIGPCRHLTQRPARGRQPHGTNTAERKFVYVLPGNVDSVQLLLWWEPFTDDPKNLTNQIYLGNF